MGKHSLHHLEHDLRRSTDAIQRSAGDALCDFADQASAAVDAASQAPAVISRSTHELLETGRSAARETARVVERRPRPDAHELLRPHLD